MSIKGRVNSVEILFSIAFMGIVVFFCYQMLLRQQRIVKKVNQNIEVTSFIYQVRDMLKGVGCRTNLAGFSRVTPPGKITTLKRVVSFMDGTSSISSQFSLDRGQAGNWSLSGLSIDQIELNPRGLDQSVRSDRTFLHITFNRDEFNEKFKQLVRIYTKDTNGVITDCSLVPFTKSRELWRQEGDALAFQGDDLGIGTQNFVGRLNVEGGAFFSQSLTGCSSEGLGTIQYDKKKMSWTLCTKRGLVSLVDGRMLNE